MARYCVQILVPRYHPSTDAIIGSRVVRNRCTTKLRTAKKWAGRWRKELEPASDYDEVIQIYQMIQGIRQPLRRRVRRRPMTRSMRRSMRRELPF